MAENQTATEDSGQQSKQHNHQHQHQNQQQQQTKPTQQEQLNPSAISPTTSPQDNSAASSPEDSQSSIAVAIPNSTSLYHNHHKHQMPEHLTRSMIDRQSNSKLKSNASCMPRRNSMQASMRPASTTAIRKPTLTKMSSLTNASTITGPANVDKHHQHHHHHSQHAHAHHNNTSPSNHHSGSSSSSIIQRTTSESLRLHSLYDLASAITAAKLSNASSSSLSLPLSPSHMLSNNNNNNNNSSSTSSSTSALPRSTSTTGSVANTKATSTTTTNTTPKSKASSAKSSISSNASANTSNRVPHSPGHVNAAHSTNSSRKPKTDSSFEITSVTMGKRQTKAKTQHHGEESTDDLDESHADDNSRVTDLDTETPSMSEDTSYSKEEVYFTNNALSAAAPVISTSPQYGLVVVEPLSAPTLGEALQNMQVNLGDNIINMVTGIDGQKKPDEDLKDSQQRSERFKVVKIESTEPFKRGRWVCMDYLDHSSIGGNGDNEKTGNSELGGGEGGNGTDEQHTAKTTQSMIVSAGAAALLLDNHTDAAGNTLPGAEGHWTFIPEGQEPSCITVGTEHSSGVATAPATVATGLQELINEGMTPPAIIADSIEKKINAVLEASSNSNQQPQSGDSGIEANVHDTSATEGVEETLDFATAAAQKLRKAQQELKEQEEAILASEKAGTIYVPAQSQPVAYMNQIDSVVTSQAATLPANMTIQNSTEIAALTTSELKTQTQIETQKELTELNAISQMIKQQSLPNTGHQMMDANTITTTEFQQQVTPQATFPNTTEIDITQQQLLVPSSIKQQQHSPQLSPATPQLQQQVSQTDGPAVVPTSMTPTLVDFNYTTTQIPSQFQQQTLAAGQTMPYASPSTVREVQHQTQLTSPTTLQQQHSAPSTIVMDNHTIVAAMQAQQAAASAEGVVTNQLLQNTTYPLNTSSSSPNVTIQLNQQKTPTTSSLSSNITMGAATLASVSANTSNISANTATINPLTNLPSTTIITPNVLPPTTIITPNTAAVAAAAAAAAHNVGDDKQQQQPSPTTITTLPSTTSVVPITPSPQPQHQQLQSTVMPPTQTTAAAMAAATIVAGASAPAHQQPSTQQINPSETETESASGTSAVAIDNKIEQAMDLVKSHLMIAVREEVEVLKEKISELLDKINQLEVENTMLKANIPSETLQQLQITGSAPSNMIAAAPANQSTVATPTGIAATAVSGGTGGNTTPAVSMASPTAAATPTSSAATDVSVGSETSSNEVVSTISELPGVSSNGPMS